MRGNRSTATKARQSSELATEVATQVCGLFEIESWHLMFDGANRAGNAVVGRSLFWYVMYLRWNHSTTELEALTNFNASTIRTGILSIAEQLKTDRELQRKAKVLGV